MSLYWRKCKSRISTKARILSFIIKWSNLYLTSCKLSSILDFFWSSDPSYYLFLAILLNQSAYILIKKSLNFLSGILSKSKWHYLLSFKRSLKFLNSSSSSSSFSRPTVFFSSSTTTSLVYTSAFSCCSSGLFSSSPSSLSWSLVASSSFYKLTYFSWFLFSWLSLTF